MNNTVTTAVVVGTACTVAAVVLTNVALAAPQIKAKFHGKTIKSMLHVES